MAVQEWKCVTCEKMFKAGDWICQDGISNHKVELKIYRCLDAPGDAELKDGRTVVCNIPPATKVMRGDEVTWEGEGSVEFVRGIYTTEDPQKQYWLDKKVAYNATQEQWNGVWLSERQQFDIEKMQLNAEKQRLENERNDLLAQVQRQKKEPVAATR